MYFEKFLSLVMLIGFIGVFNVKGDEFSGRLREENWAGIWYLLAYDQEYSSKPWPYCPSMSLYEFWQEELLPNADYCVYVNQTEDADYLKMTWPRTDAFTTLKVTSRVILENELYDWEMHDNDENLLGHIFVSRNPKLLLRFPKLLADKNVLYADCPEDPDIPTTTEAFYYDEK